MLNGHRGPGPRRRATATRSRARASSSARSPTADQLHRQRRHVQARATARGAPKVATRRWRSREVRPMTAEIAAVSGGAPVAVVVGEDNASSAGALSGLAPALSSSPSSSSPRRGLRLVAAAEARPAGPRPGHLRHRRSRAARFTPNGDCRFDRDPDPLPRHPVRPRDRPDRQARRQAGRHPRPRHASSSATASSPSTGTAAAATTAPRPPGRYKLRVKLLGQDRTLVPPGAMRLHRAPRSPRRSGCRPAERGAR